MSSRGFVIHSSSHTVAPEHKGTNLFWPGRLLGPPPGLKEINLACWTLFVAFLLVPLCFVHVIQMKRGVGSVRQLNSDFVYLYGVGEIAREYPPARIYDSALQHQVFLSIQPPRDGTYGPSPYPPFVAMFFIAFTHLSFETAYYLWLAISLALYLFGIRAAAETIFPAEWLKTSLIICFALAFYPFIFATLLNGQLASVAVCAVGLAIHQEKLGNLFRSGLALALLSYKPTLLLLVVPMLLLTRRFRTLLGFTTGAGTLILGATAFAGAQIWPLYMRMLREFGRVTGVRGTSHLQLWKYVDLSSASAAISGSRFALGAMILTFAVGAIAAMLALLWRSARSSPPVQWLAWAATLTWTLLLNVYVPIYDSILVTIAIVLTLGALRDLGWNIAAEWTTFLAIILFAVSWKTESFAEAHGVQLLTIMLAALGLAQLLLLHWAMRQKFPEPVASSV